MPRHTYYYWKRKIEQVELLTIQSTASEEARATFFYYSRTWGSSVPAMLLEGYHGYLTDAYVGYENVTGIKRNLCWAHVRHYMIESIPLDSNGKEIPGFKGGWGWEFINLLFKLEDGMKALSYEEEKEKRQVVSRAILDAFWVWVEETSAKKTTNEKLTTALRYAANHREHLETFLEDGRLEISNNLCESHIRPFATGRWAWLFADTPAQGDADTDFHNQPELIDAYLPWSQKLLEECRMVDVIF